MYPSASPEKAADVPPLKDSMKTVIAERYKKYSDYINSIPSLFSTNTGEVLKDKRNSVRRLEHDGLTFIAKRYKRVNWIQSIIYTHFRRTKAKRAFLFADEKAWSQVAARRSLHGGI